jgi:hypothetical protein
LLGKSLVQVVANGREPFSGCGRQVVSSYLGGNDTLHFDGDGLGVAFRNRSQANLFSSFVLVPEFDAVKRSSVSRFSRYTSHSFVSLFVKGTLLGLLECW